MSPIQTLRTLKSLPAIFLCLFLASSSAIAQSPAPQPAAASPSSAPTFEVATIKPSPADTSGRFVTGLSNMPDGLSALSTPLYEMVQFAYGLSATSQISGGPDWAKTDPYDLQAKMSGPDAEAFKTLLPAEQKTHRQLMLQALLADRFKLKTHSETKQVPTFDLVTIKDISRLKPDPDHRAGTPGAGVIRFGKESSSFVGKTMANFAGFLSQPDSGVGRPVIDKTGLTSTYSFTLNWGPQWRGMPGAASPQPLDESAPSIFTALTEIGLKLQPSTGAIQIIVIDQAERPTPN